MKKVVFAAVLSVVALALALPTFADEAKKDVKPEKPKHQDFSGAITAVDAAKGSLTIKNHKDVEKTFAVTDTAKVVTADKAVAALADLKVGDKVRVTYTTDDAGKITVTKIAPSEKPKPVKTDDKK